ncbi:antibiotic biosynthesis monooxygenase [Hydrogenophaga sp.]|jgi:heme-degrading monooxygenase HmoA|uniref:antibiotic biosynthesis monooxygenase family protein n=1 Tax=Hydrogenophaga sp. TaxID=1904254 RepID=UPI002721081E|nr:antibiotic biosynthesis monooxygenase family protein [Hydrogenophaga sp.]MDO9603147.1 antibiotic biosynthesis monooxygenase family protein [Hydrogenophaga sp.]
MFLEIVSLWIRPGQQAGFEQAFAKAQRLLVGARGYLAHDLQCSLDSDQNYALLIEWRLLEDSTLGFRKSGDFERWLELLQGFLMEAPQIHRYRAVATGRCQA